MQFATDFELLSQKPNLDLTVATLIRRLGQTAHQLPSPLIDKERWDFEIPMSS